MDTDEHRWTEDLLDEFHKLTRIIELKLMAEGIFQS
jgi:hypothetical protein